eukprot:1924063-Amphidinium_carterae.1
MIFVSTVLYWNSLKHWWVGTIGNCTLNNRGDKHSSYFVRTNFLNFCRNQDAVNPTSRNLQNAAETNSEKTALPHHPGGGRQGALFIYRAVACSPTAV